MKPGIVVDVGNSRVKWGRCSPDAVLDSVSLPPDDPDSWQQQLDRWHREAAAGWIVASVHPGSAARLADWLRQRGQVVCSVEDWRQLPLRILVEFPERVGMDRLLDAVAANGRRPAGTPAVLIDAGSAVTVDWVDADGAFGGGAILPGLRLMAQALHDYTALLPLVAVAQSRPAVPARSTPSAVEAGVYWAVVGGIRALTQELTAAGGAAPVVFLTGGDGPLLQPALDPATVAWPLMTLEGIRLTAETLP